MLNRSIFLFFVAAAASGAAHAASHMIEGWSAIDVIADIEPRNARPSIQIVTGERANYCSTYEVPPGVFCSANVRDKTEIARVEITAPGYKKFSRNVPRLEFRNNTAKIDLGSVQLTQSELPSIRNITLGENTEGARRFEITFHNPLETEFLIEKVDVSLHLPGAPIACCCPPSASFVFEESLSVVSMGAEEISLTGAVRELVRSADFAITVSASASKSGCTGGETVSFSIPTSFILPSTKYSAIQIRLPKKFSIKEGSWGWGESPADPDIMDFAHEAWREGAEASFTISTDAPDELEIRGRYPDN